ncbi:phytoene desaturase family protein [Hahella sp. NBU794]|uniref:phytoene desaturase family protein n=1 Tax=Hahella sp. NBU794 TaxID=3422590 RepID=UPI003D6F9A69
MVRTGKRYRKNRADDHYDVIIIGSGVGGLCNAALLSLIGKKVCVLEQHYTAGGYTHSYERNGYEWDVGVHYIGEVHKPWSMIRRVFDLISDGKIEWAEMDPCYDRIFIGEDNYDFIAGKEPFINEMARRFPGEEDAIRRYVDLLYSVSRRIPKFFAGQALPKIAAWAYHKARRFLLPDYFFKTTREVLEGLTQNQRLISVLTAQWGDYGLPPTTSSFMMHAMVAKHYITGGNYPVGGSWRIAEEIIPVIRRSGGEVFTYAQVAEVLVRSNRAYGVRLSNGDELQADAVVSDAGVIPTIKHLLPESAAAKGDLLKKLEGLALSASHLCLYAGFRGSPESLGMPRSNFWIYPSDDHDGNVARFMDDPSAPFPVTYVSFPSAKDPTWNARYPDRSTVEIIVPVNNQWFDKWAGSQWNKRGEDYLELKEQFSHRMLDELYKRLPQLESALDFYELSTPLSTQWFQMNMGGEIYGVDHTVERFQQDWLHPVTPIKNFYLTGADIVTAGVGGALMGGVMTSFAMLGKEGYKLGRLLKQGPQPAQPASEVREAG